MNAKLDLLRRTMAALLDIVIVFISGFFILTTVVTPLFTVLVPEFPTNQETFRSLQLESFIYYEDENQVVVSYDYESYSLTEIRYDYSEAVYDYYALFKNDKIYDESTLPFEFTIAWFNQTILKVGEENTLFELNEFNELSVLATPKTTTTENQLKEFYFQAYRDANNDLLSYPPFRALRDELNWIIIQILFVSITLVVGVFYFAIPIWLGNGQTWMKRLFKIVVVNKQGFRITRGELFLRAVGTWISFVALAFSLEGTLLVVYATMIFTPFNRAPHDFLAMTRVLDGRNLTIFNNHQDKEAFEKKIEVVDVKS
jgi:uncharacterized RDD family membrane protein YckC